MWDLLSLGSWPKKMLCWILSSGVGMQKYNFLYYTNGMKSYLRSGKYVLIDFSKRVGKRVKENRIHLFGFILNLSMNRIFNHKALWIIRKAIIQWYTRYTLYNTILKKFFVFLHPWSGEIYIKCFFNESIFLLKQNFKLS